MKKPIIMMPWGRYALAPIEKLPTSYLVKCLARRHLFSRELRRALEAEYERRVRARGR